MFHKLLKKTVPLLIAATLTLGSLPVNAAIDQNAVSQVTTTVEEPADSIPEKTPVTVNLSLKASAFKKMSTKKFIRTLGPIAQADSKESGVLASVTMAQAILESGWGKSQLAQKANNLFGMKTSLSGNTWKGSTWDKKSKYKKRTAEYGKNNRKYYITAHFRKYNSVARSIGDHSAYLTGAKNGKAYRYKGLTKTDSYKKQLTIIRKGGYATSKTYVKDLCKIIKKYKLYEWDL